MLYFDSDYMEGAHPAILQRLMETNMEHTYGYGKAVSYTHLTYDICSGRKSDVCIDDPENNRDCFCDLRMFSGNHWFRCV